ncbi:Levanase precursor [Planctomycetes bacterium CA13]|uniref:Levanase n=1 Tax=Novipirellula herctigrandis TaxID=2527986 RepID=A0A5C5ZB94_9BACT|nr:Levanase precursor [Planctomycetes bacterium CA13]
MKHASICTVSMLVTLYGALLAQDVIAVDPNLYHESLRPRFHFTAKSDYINDPNGLVYVDGVYHLFFQTGPISAKRWGHATSQDMVRWTQLDDAILPKDGHPAFSGCAVVDRKNTSGLQTGDDPPIVAIFTSWGQGQSLAYSNDRGETWTRHHENPVLMLAKDSQRSFPLSARDPMVIWDPAKDRWTMILYDNLNDKVLSNLARDRQGGFSFFTSANLIDWTRQSHLPGFYVCPDVMELPIEGTDKTEWVAMDWAQYVTGRFNGSKFTANSTPYPLDFGKNLSANQTWKNLPDGRIVQISWIRGGKYPKMPFDQQMSFPTSLTLRQIGDHRRLCKQPIDEIKTLYGKSASAERLEMPQSVTHKLDVGSNSVDVEFEVQLGDRSELQLSLLGTPIAMSRNSISVLKNTVYSDEPLSHLRILADITSIEIFANHGSKTITLAILSANHSTAIELTSVSGTSVVENIRLHEVTSCWNRSSIANDDIDNSLVTPVARERGVQD